MASIVDVRTSDLASHSLAMIAKLLSGALSNPRTSSRKSLISNQLDRETVKHTMLS